MKLKRKALNTVLTFLLTLIIIDFIARSKYLPSFQFSLLILAIVSYLIWAFVYHKLDKSLTLSNYLEYVLTATLAIILMLGILNI